MVLMFFIGMVVGMMVAGWGYEATNWRFWAIALPIDLFFTILSHYTTSGIIP